MADVNDVGSRENFTGWLIRETYAENGEIPDKACQAWTNSDTAPVGIIPLTEEMCAEFHEALGQDAAGEITEEEKQALRVAGVPDGVIYAVGGENGKRALQERARWFAGKKETPDKAKDEKKNKRIIVSPELVEKLRNVLRNDEK